MNMSNALREHQEVLLLASGLSLIILLIVVVCIYLNLDRVRQRRQLNAAMAEKRSAYANSTVTWTKAHLPVQPTTHLNVHMSRTNQSVAQKIPRELSSQTICETIAPANVPSNYKTFDLAKRSQRQLSSDSSYASSNHRRSQPLSFTFDTVKSKFQSAHRRSSPSPTSYRPLETIKSDHISKEHSSDSDELERESDSTSITAASSLGYSLADIFRIEIIYRLQYSIDHRQLLFQIIRLQPIQPLIERCFPSLICKIRLFTGSEKRKNKKYFSKKDPTNELFQFDMNENQLNDSYLKIDLLGHHKNDKRLELGHALLVLNEYKNLILRGAHRHHGDGLSTSEQHSKFIQIDDERIDMITQYQARFTSPFTRLTSSSSLSSLADDVGQQRSGTDLFGLRERSMFAACGFDQTRWHSIAPSRTYGTFVSTR